MSASGPPTPDEIAQQFDLTPQEADAVANALAPLNQLTSLGEEFGNSLATFDSVGPQLLGVVLQNLSKQVDLAASNTQMIARALQFYIERQQGAATNLVPPPEEAAAQFGEDMRPLVDAIRDVTSQTQ